VEMKSAVDVSDEAVELMLAESLEHAFEDVGERIWTETKLKSEEMLAGVDAAMQLVGDKIDRSQKAEILGLAEKVRQALRTHKIDDLKRANEALDRATQTLAALVLQTAMGLTPAG
jgi:molecular chaperone DnaK